MCVFTESSQNASISLTIKLFYSAAGGRFGGGRGHNSLIGTSVRVRLGRYKGCKGIVKDVKGQTVRVELEAQMKDVTG